MTRNRQRSGASGRVAAVLLLVSSAAAGCAAPGPARDRTGKGPREALVEYYGALAEGRDEGVFARLGGSGEVRDSMRLFLKFVRAARAFRARIVAAYGEDGWRRFDGQDATQPLLDQLSLPAEEAAWLPVVADGSTAFVWKKAGGGWLRLGLDGGLWKVETGSGSPSEMFVVGLLAVKAEAMERFLPEVGKTGVTPESLANKVADAVRSQFQPAPEPDAPPSPPPAAP